MNARNARGKNSSKHTNIATSRARRARPVERLCILSELTLPILSQKIKDGDQQYVFSGVKNTNKEAVGKG
uniref:Kinesin motor domain-containing protein n=1 Tax=Heterorhabditis bacteriophora TaxID=37862 RepID=A0A1I7XJT7_HETBA